MRYIFSFFLAFYIHSAYGQEWSIHPVHDPEPPDTLRGIAVVLEQGGVMTLDTATNRLKLIPQGIMTPVHAICIRTPIDLVSPDMRGKSVGYVTTFFRIDDGRQISANDVLMFKIREE